ncbi:MAG: glycosyltransferase family 39 protein, partial [Anaerolineae bacterium]
MGEFQIANRKYQVSDSRKRLIFVICYLTFLSLALLLRLAPLGRYVTPDEPAWVYRSIRFADALAARDWAAVPSTGHPGVTTMWLGALNVTLCRLLSPAESTTHLDWIGRMAWLDPENSEAFRHLAFFLPGGRIAVALVTTAGLAILYPLLHRLFDRRLALLALGLLALDPFLSGHSGILHTDALLATFTLLALVATLNGLREPRRAIWWMLSGLFTGLALLTKTPAIILVPFIGLVQLTAHFRKSQILRLRSGQAANHKSSIGHWPLFIIHCSLFIL